MGLRKGSGRRLLHERKGYTRGLTEEQIRYKAEVEDEIGKILFNVEDRQVRFPYSLDIVSEMYYKAGVQAVNGLLRYFHDRKVKAAFAAKGVLQIITTKELFFDKSHREINFRENPLLLEAQKHVSPAKQEAEYSPLTGFQTGRTSAIDKWVSRFPGNDLQTIERLIDAIGEIEVIDDVKKVAPSMMKAVYGMRTASDILHSERIAGKNFGCNDMCVALIAVLKAKGIPCKFVRTITYFDIGSYGAPHSVVLFRIGKLEYIANPFTSPGLRLHMVDDHMRFQIGRLRRGSLWFEGKDAWDLGMFGWQDYAKHLNTRFLKDIPEIMKKKQ